MILINAENEVSPHPKINCELNQFLLGWKFVTHSTVDWWFVSNMVQSPHEWLKLGTHNEKSDIIRPTTVETDISYIHKTNWSGNVRSLDIITCRPRRARTRIPRRAHRSGRGANMINKHKIHEEQTMVAVDSVSSSNNNPYRRYIYLLIWRLFGQGI